MRKLTAMTANKFLKDLQSHAASFAEAIVADSIFIGAHSEDSSGYT